MKILFLADPSNPHTIKWVNSLSKRGIDIFLFGLSNYDKAMYADSIKIESLKTPSVIKSKLSGNLFKVIYFSVILKLRRICSNYNPDILHAHYAGSYGLLGALTKFHPYILSVWGVDINIYPKVSFVHSRLINYALKKTDYLLATSNILKEETLKYVDKEIEVTPFGIDLNIFKPMRVNSLFSEDDIVIGTVKRLEEKYGIDELIKTFAVLKNKHTDIPLKLLLVGEGSIRSRLMNLVDQLGIAHLIIFTGEILVDKVAEYHNMIDISVFLSKTESFGVSILEASATEKPVVVTRVGGLPEVVDNGVTGIVIELGDREGAVKAIEKLVLDSELRRRMGKAGREKVYKEYNWNDNVQQMINIYEKVLKSNEDKKS